MKKIRVSTGSAAVLNLRNVKTRSKTKTIYLMNSGGCEYNCGFCAQASGASSKEDKLSRVSWPEYDTEKVMDSLSENAAEYKRVCMQVVNTKNVFDTLPDTVAEIRKSTPNAKIAMTIRTYKMDDVDRMFGFGADEVGLSIDAIDPDQFQKIKGGSFEYHKKFVLDAADKYPGRIATHLIVGMGEREKQVVELMKELHAHKVIIALFAFTPVRGARMEFTEAPDMSAYRRIQVALYLIRNALDREFEYDEEGRIVGFGYDRDSLFELIKGSNAFETSGCSDCNRPYYNERAGAKDLYNYPHKIENDRFVKVFETIFEYSDRIARPLTTNMGALKETTIS